MIRSRVSRKYCTEYYLVVSSVCSKNRCPDGLTQCLDGGAMGFAELLYRIQRYVKLVVFIFQVAARGDRQNERESGTGRGRAGRGREGGGGQAGFDRQVAFCILTSCRDYRLNEIIEKNK